MSNLLTLTDLGLYCEAGDFFIDPWRPVHRAVITHAHADHARPGSKHYLCAAEGQSVLQLRMGDEAHIETLPYHEPTHINGVRVSFHPAGHILGSAQIRVEHAGEVWVVSGDYKTESDSTCTDFEAVKCHTFITEATFGLPIYRWRPQAETFQEINAWWQQNQTEGKASIIFAYALGKAQRVLAGLDPTLGPIYVHGAVHNVNQAYAKSGISLPKTQYVGDMPKQTDWSQALIVAPTSADGTPWLRRFGPKSRAFASGWMRVRGQRRRRSMDRGFAMSDHVDWPNLMRVIEETEAERILVTHGYIPPVVRWLREQGLEAYGLDTEWQGEQDSEADTE